MSEKIKNVFIIALCFFTCFSAFGQNSKKTHNNPIGLYLEAGFSLPVSYQEFSASPSFFDTETVGFALNADAQARYKIPRTNLMASVMFGIGKLTVMDDNMWNTNAMNAMEGLNWSVLGGIGYPIQFKKGNFTLVPSGVAGIQHEDFSGSFQLNSLDEILRKENYEYSGTNVLVGIDLYFIKKINRMFGISFSVTPMLCYGLNGKLKIKNKLNDSEFSMSAKAENRSYVLDSKLNFVFCL